MILYTDQLKDQKWNITTKRSHHKGKDGKYKTDKYLNDIITFDIECTSAWIDETGQIITYKKCMGNDYWNNLQPLALCYLWQCSVNDTVYYGRELESFTKVLDALPEGVKVIIWVHNLSYEFQFLCNIFTWNKVFARLAHKPMKATCKEYPFVEFRCSYMLTRLSLASWGKQLGVHKAVGDLDYDKLRTPLTPLTDEELHYGEMDCLVLYAGIQDYVKKYKMQHRIPLTQTGTVRREVKDLLVKDKQYVRHMKKLVPKSPEEYKRLQNVFAGGYTHANQMYSGKLVDEYIEHYDFASSYPAVMFCEKYPMEAWYYNGNNRIPVNDDTFDHTAHIFYLQFTKIESISFNTYIQQSRCICYNPKVDNGRILYADALEIYCTEQDWITIRNNYRWDTLKVVRVWRSEKEYLPRPFLQYILELYGNKTSLKDVPGQEDLYMQSKQYINSLFGMMVTALIQSDVMFDGGEWNIKKLTAEDVQKKLNKLRDFHDKNRRYFLSYSWGCWVTAYARRNLWECMESCDHDILYCDTDSIFVRGRQDFSWYNEKITEKIRKSCEYNNLDFELTRPLTPEGKAKPLGIFTKEPDCTQFKTLGAKRYVERRATDNKLHLTVSGINKDAVELLNDNIDNFKDGFDFNMDADCVHKKLSVYLDDIPEVTYPDGYVSKYKYGINMRNTGYVLSITDEYKLLIKYMEYALDELPEAFVNHLRGTWEE